MKSKEVYKVIGGEIGLKLKSVRLDCSIPQQQDITFEDESGALFHVCCGNNPELITKLENAIKEARK